MARLISMEMLIANPGLIGSLAVLALIDATSVGTLAIPLMLLVVGRGSGRTAALRAVLYLLVIGAFYWALGIALLAGLLPLYRAVGGVLATLPGQAVLAAIGAVLVWWSYRVDPAEIRKRGGDPEAGARRWIERVRSAMESFPVLAGLALLAGVLESASMIPYLAAMAILARSGIGLGAGALVLAAYCLLMIAPGLLLACVRAAVGERADGALGRLERWTSAHTSSAFAWAIGIVGVIILVRTVPGLIGSLTS